VHQQQVFPPLFGFGGVGAGIDIYKLSFFCALFPSAFSKSAPENNYVSVLFRNLRKLQGHCPLERRGNPSGARRHLRCASSTWSFGHSVDAVDGSVEYSKRLTV